ncbi:MAG TPA: aminopeptidase N [Dermatophilaceae bacterium]|nr:aminopeptidase N [Dermatophilaceae bacterium]
MPSLTRAEAAHRGALLVVDRYAVELDLDLPERGDTHFASTTTITWHGLAAGETFLDVKAADLHEVTLDGTPLDLAGWADGRLPMTVTSGPHTLRVVATMAFRRDGSGLHRAIDPADGEAYVYAQSFLDDAPALFACFDQPDLKARIALQVKAPEHWTIVANGHAEQVATGRWTCTETEPISTYLVTVCGGPYASVRSEHDGIPLALHARRSLAPQLHRWSGQIFEVTGQAFDAYHELFGIRYPFGDYAMVFVTDFNAVAMENPGCVTIRDELLYRGAATEAEVQSRSRTVVHELAHMWFGNLVTMRWWDDLWLNESFAEYLAVRVLSTATEFRDSWVSFGISRKLWGYAAERAPSTHPVAGAPALTASDALSDFDGISYAKGATAIGQLIGFVGDEAFIAGVAAYLRDKAFGNGTFAEFLAAIEQASGRDLQGWAQRWLLTADRDTLSVDVTSSPPALVKEPSTRTPVTDRPHVLTVSSYAAHGTSATRVHTAAARTPLAELTIGASPRVVLPNSNDLTWAAVDLDADSVAALPQLLPTIADTQARSVIWQALEDGVHRAALDPAAYLRVVEAALAHESYVALLDRVAGGARTIARLFVADEQRCAAEQLIAQVGERILAEAEPGSARATVGARIVVGSSIDERRLRGWLTEPPAWLAGDHDFRWSVLTGLARAGLVEEAELAAGEAADPSVQGRLRALSARASRPTPEAKAWAFAELTGRDSGRTSHELIELSAGLWVSPTVELVRGHVEPWLEAIEQMREWVGQDALTKVVRFGFPMVVEPRTLELVDAQLARADLDPALRRALTEWSWPLREALASRARFPTRA